MVSAAICHRGDPGSIPSRAKYFSVEKFVLINCNYLMMIIIKFLTKLNFFLTEKKNISIARI